MVPAARIRSASRPLRRLARRPLAAVVAAAGAWLAACAASPARPAAPTLATITIDGDLDDWTQVLANPLQVTLDGDGSVAPCAASTDRDCPVEPSEADLRAFAWTHDATHLYLHVRRQARGAAPMVAWVYLDRDLDGRMGSDDRVLRLRHDGGTRATTATLFPYAPLFPSGDAMTDAAGRGDGHALIGDGGTSSYWHGGTRSGGTARGDAFEERVPWSALGVPAGTPLGFHVASATSHDPALLSESVVDDLGGPEGGLGSLGHWNVAIEPGAREAVTAPGGTVTLVHVVANAGTRPASFALGTWSALGSRVALGADADADGTAESIMAVDADGDGDYLDAGDVVDPAHDADGDGVPDTPVLAPGGAFGVVLEVTPSAPSGSRDRVTARAWHVLDPDGIVAAAADSVDVGAVVVRRDGAAGIAAGNLARHAVQACAAGVAERIALRVASSAGWDVRLLLDPACDGSGTQVVALDRRGDGSWDQVTGSDSDGDRVPDSGLLAPGTCACFVLTVDVPSNAALGASDATTLTGTGSMTLESGDALLATEVVPRLALVPPFWLALGTEKRTGAGGRIVFPHVVRNGDAVPATASLARDPPTSSAGWPVRLWSDPDGDGSLADGAPVTDVGPIPPHGGTWPLLVEVLVPDTAPPGASSTVTVRASVPGPPRFDAQVVDDALVAAVTTHADPASAPPASSFAPCAVVHARATGLERAPPAGGWDLGWSDAAGATVQFRRGLAPDGTGRAADAYALRASDGPGDWLVDLRRADETVSVAPFRIEADTSIADLRAQPGVVPPAGASVGVTTTLANGNAEAPVEGSVIEHVVLDPSRAFHLVAGASGTYAPWDGTQLTRSAPVPRIAAGTSTVDAFAVPDVTHLGEGVHVVLATWRASCGFVLARAAAELVVDAGEACANGADDDLDGATDCDDAGCARDPACFEADCAGPSDSDADGLAGCADPDCAPRCPETACADGLDGDGDGAADCADDDCAATPACVEADCAGSADTDGDGLAGCADPDCVAACPEGDCTNGRDDDGDAGVDCADADCALDAACFESACTDGMDNDGDGPSDCADPDCARDLACTEEACADMLDEDGDTLVDCADPDCRWNPWCTEFACTNGLDDDGDGATDCRDPDCGLDPACIEWTCDDGLDEDGDTLVDCADDDCLAFPRCDLDGDGSPNEDDCAPGNAGVFAAPGPLALAASHVGGGVARVSWTDVAALFGPATGVDVLEGRLGELRADRGFARAGCLARDVSLPVDDARLLGSNSDGWYYLARAENACGRGPWGAASDATPRDVPAATCN